MFHFSSAAGIPARCFPGRIGVPSLAQTPSLLPAQSQGAATEPPGSSIINVPATAAINQAPRQTTPPWPHRVYAHPSLALYCAMEMELFQQPQLLLGAKTVPLNTSISRTGKTTRQPSPKPCSDSYPGGAPRDLPHSCSGQSLARASSAQGGMQLTASTHTFCPQAASPCLSNVVGLPRSGLRLAQFPAWTLDLCCLFNGPLLCS